MSDIPSDLIVEILLFLPVLSLLRFRVVSKQWRALIDSSTFRKSHSNNVHKEKHSMMMLSTYYGVHCVEFDSVSDGSAATKFVRYPQRVSIYDFSYALGPCNGFFCMTTLHHGAFLWNPFTNKHLNISQPLELADRELLNGWSFGYDSYLDDYKLVCVTRTNQKHTLPRFPVWVYSVKAGIWKRIGDMPYFLVGNGKGPGVFVSGALHWEVLRVRGSPNPTINIVALDLRNSEYNLVPIPEYWIKYARMNMRLWALDGCLYVTFYDNSPHPGFDLWVMNEYGVKESWNRLITCTTHSDSLLKPFSFYIPLAYVENGKKFLLIERCISNSLVEYDFETGSFKRAIHMVLPQHITAASVYTPSLLFPPQTQSGARVGDSVAITCVSQNTVDAHAFGRVATPYHSGNKRKTAGDSSILAVDSLAARKKIRQRLESWNR